MIDFDFLMRFKLDFDYIKFDFRTQRLFVGIEVPLDFDDRVFYMKERKRFSDELRNRGYVVQYTTRNADYDVMVFEREGLKNEDFKD